MALDKDSRSAITGSKPTGDRKSNCTGTDDLGRNSQSIAVIIGEASSMRMSQPTACVKSA